MASHTPDASANNVGPVTNNSTKLRTVLLAVDQSEHSMFAVTYALQMVCTSSDKLHILHVSDAIPITIPGATPDGVDVYIPDDYLEELKKESAANSTAIVKKYAAMAAEAHVSSEGYFMTGDPRDLIVEEVAAIGADLLIIGCRGLGPVREAFLGSVSMHCLHHASCPVLIVRRPEEGLLDAAQEPAVRKGQRTVVLSVDQSEPSKMVVSWAFSKFCRPDSDHVVLLTANPAVSSTWPDYADFFPSDHAEKLEQSQRESSQKRLDSLAQRGRNLGFDVSTAVECGDAREVICAVAQKLPADVVVLGSRGLGNVSRLVLGSVSNYCSHHLPCPVLIVKTHGDAIVHEPHADSAHLS